MPLSGFPVKKRTVRLHASIFFKVLLQLDFSIGNSTLFEMAEFIHKVVISPIWAAASTKNLINRVNKLLLQLILVLNLSFILPRLLDIAIVATTLYKNSCGLE